MKVKTVQDCINWLMMSKNYTALVGALPTSASRTRTVLLSILNVTWLFYDHLIKTSCLHSALVQRHLGLQSTDGVWVSTDHFPEPKLRDLISLFTTSVYSCYLPTYLHLQDTRTDLFATRRTLWTVNTATARSGSSYPRSRCVGLQRCWVWQAVCTTTAHGPIILLTGRTRNI